MVSGNIIPMSVGNQWTFRKEICDPMMNYINEKQPNSKFQRTINYYDYRSTRVYNPKCSTVLKMYLSSKSRFSVEKNKCARHFNLQTADLKNFKINTFHQMKIDSNYILNSKKGQKRLLRLIKMNKNLKAIDLQLFQSSFYGMKKLTMKDVPYSILYFAFRYLPKLKRLQVQNRNIATSIIQKAIGMGRVLKQLDFFGYKNNNYHFFEFKDDEEIQNRPFDFRKAKNICLDICDDQIPMAQQIISFLQLPQQYDLRFQSDRVSYFKGIEAMLPDVEVLSFASGLIMHRHSRNLDFNFQRLKLEESSCKKILRINSRIFEDLLIDFIPQCKNLVGLELMLYSEMQKGSNLSENIILNLSKLKFVILDILECELQSESWLTYLRHCKNLKQLSLLGYDATIRSFKTTLTDTRKAEDCFLGLGEVLKGFKSLSELYIQLYSLQRQILPELKHCRDGEISKSISIFHLKGYEKNPNNDYLEYIDCFKNLVELNLKLNEYGEKLNKNQLLKFQEGAKKLTKLSKLDLSTSSKNYLNHLEVSFFEYFVSNLGNLKFLKVDLQSYYLNGGKEFILAPITFVQPNIEVEIYLELPIRFGQYYRNGKSNHLNRVQHWWDKVQVVKNPTSLIKVLSTNDANSGFVHQYGRKQNLDI